MVNIKETKIETKVNNPKIICVKHANGKKYYCIKYYDFFTGEYHVGFGSFRKKFAKRWLRTEFVAVPKIDIETHSNANNRENL